MARRGRKKSSIEQANNKGIQQLGNMRLENHLVPIEPLDSEQLELIHNASLQILEEQGIEVLGEMALQLFRQAGADVNEEGVVRMDRDLVLQCIEKAPSEFDIAARNSERTIHCGGNVVNFGLVSGPPNVHDCIQGRRAGNLADYQKIVKLGQFFDAIGFFGTQSVATTDLPVNSRHLDTLFCNLTLGDKPFSAIGIGGGRSRDAVKMCAISRGLPLEALAESPSVMTNININSPRKLDDSMAYGAMQMAMLGQATVVTPFTLMGAMTPATMAGALAQQNAEALLGISLLQHYTGGAHHACTVALPLMSICVQALQRLVHRKIH